MAKILVVDDDEIIRRTAERILRHMKHEVHLAPDGALGYQKTREANPDYIVSDVQMPDMSGPAMVAALRAEGFDKPILLMSGALGDERKAVEELIKTGQVAGLLEKPFDLTEFQRAVEELTKPTAAA